MDGEPVKFRDKVRLIRVTAFGSYMFKESLDEDEIWKKVDICKLC